MFNFFKKQNKEQEDNCYLIKSGLFQEKIENTDSLKQYSIVLANSESDNDFKEIIRTFLIPYKIHCLKFHFNQNYYVQSHNVDLKYNHRHISPTLQLLKENPFGMARGYPIWYISVFPDVVYWALNEGSEDVMLKLSTLTEEQLIYDDQIRNEHLDTIIKMYQRKTGLSLECKDFNWK